LEGYLLSEDAWVVRQNADGFHRGLAAFFVLPGMQFHADIIDRGASETVKIFLFITLMKGGN
jgi:hypothetical protein